MAQSPGMFRLLNPNKVDDVPIGPTLRLIAPVAIRLIAEDNGLIRGLVTDKDFDAPLATLRELAYTGRGLFRPVVHPAHALTGDNWNGTVLLLKTQPANF